MPNDYPDAYYDALVLFAYGHPPGSEETRLTVMQSAVHIAGHPLKAEAVIGSSPHTIIGINDAGWMMVSGVGWRLFLGSREAAREVAMACNTLHRALIPDRTRFEQACERYIARSQDPWTEFVERSGSRLDDRSLG